MQLRPFLFALGVLSTGSGCDPSDLGDEDWGATDETGETGEPEPPDDAPTREVPYLYNPSDRPVTVWLAYPRPSLRMFCNALLYDLDAVAPELFTESFPVSVPAGGMLPLPDSWVQKAPTWCHALRLGGGDQPVATVMWRAQDHQPTPETAPIPDWNAVILDVDDEGQVLGYETMGWTPIVAEPSSPGPSQGECASPFDGVMSWTSTPADPQRIEEVSLDDDACVAVALRTQEEVDAELPPRRWTVCIPPSVFPFGVGDWVKIDAETEPKHWADRLEATIRRWDLETNGDASPMELLVLSTGQSIPSPIGGVTLDLVRAVPACPVAVNDECHTVTGTCDVVVWPFDESDPARLHPGQAVELAGTDRVVIVTALRGEERFAIDTDCADGWPDIGPDADVAVHVRRL